MTEHPQSPEPVNLPQPVVLLQRLRGTWVVAAVMMGAVSALAAACVRLFFSHLQWIFTESTAAPPVAGAHLALWRRALTPMVGALLAMGVMRVRRSRAKRAGREPRPYVEYVEAVRHGGGEVPLLPNCWRTLSAAFSIASGAAIGREGSMIQFAAAVASVSGKTLRARLGGHETSRPLEPLNLRLLVAFGVAGGVTAAYNAPLAAVFFAGEIVLGAIQWRELPLLALAAGAGRLVTGPILGWERLYPTTVSLRALAWSGLLVGLLSIKDPRVWGNGDLGLRAALGRAELPGLSIAAPALALLLGLRLLATTACVSTGTVGGVFTPTLFAGGAAGALLGHLLGHAGEGASATHAAFWAIVGMSCLMAAVTHAPLMAGCMAVELTGEWRLLPGLLLLNVIARYVARRLSPQALYAIASQEPGHPQVSVA